MRIDIEDPKEVWRAALERSRSLPLDVALWSTEGKGFDAISHHLSRWRTASLDLPTEYDISVLETHAVPQLIEFSLSLCSFPSTPYPRIDLFGGHAPQLGSLHLSDVAPASWSSPIFFGLRELQLSLIPPGCGPSIPQVMDVLSLNCFHYVTCF